MFPSKCVGALHWIVFIQCVLRERSSCCAFVSHIMMSQSHQSSVALMMRMASIRSDADKNLRMFTNKLVTASGRPVCRYALGGAARSTQPESLPLKYRDMLQNTDDNDTLGAPFIFTTIHIDIHNFCQVFQRHSMMQLAEEICSLCRVAQSALLLHLTNDLMML